MAAQRAARDARWRATDFYAVLGVSSAAPHVEVKKGFRRVALTCHPDKVPVEEREEATKRFQLIAEAYEVLSSEEQRTQYDDVRSGGGGGGGGYSGGASAPPRKPQAGRGGRTDGDSFAGFGPAAARTGEAGGQAWTSCDGCDSRVQTSNLRRCPQCPNRLCGLCRLCAACIPPDLSSDDEPAPKAKPQYSAATAAHMRQRPAAAAKPKVAPKPAARDPDAPTSAGQQWEYVRKDGGEVWRLRPEGADGDDPDGGEEEEAAERVGQPLNMVEMLIEMGFREDHARAASQKCADVPSAVEFIMKRGAGESWADQKIYEVGHAVGAAAGALGKGLQPVYKAVQPAASNLYERVQPAASAASDLASGLSNAAGALGEQLWGPAGNKEVFAGLQELGFSRAQAAEAAKRCSSVEAALEWLTAHPNIT